jgi:hypothetical protein
MNRISSGGTLVGLDLPAAGKNLELKPYAISRLTTDRIQAPPLRNDLTADAGGDLKYGLTANLTADFTYNTDFAQVEIDEQHLRFRWEYRPGSELFVVYTDERDLTDARVAAPAIARGLKNRAFVVKINRLLRF